MKQIPLTRGLFATVDDIDFEWLNRFKWFPVNGKHTFYAVRHGRKNNREQKMIRMHREILNFPKGMQVDHINGNGLWNKRANLRIVTNQQNSMNKRLTKNVSSKYKGVSFVKQNKIWSVSIKYNYKKIHLGLFDNEIEASIAYNQMAVELFGQYAHLNPIPDEYKNIVPIRRKLTKAEFQSQYVGVSWSKASQKWMARILKNKKRQYLGIFATEEEAHQAVLKTEKEVKF